MTTADVMRRLESMGTEQNRKVYARHGCSTRMFGVSFANLGALKKSIKINHQLAQELWSTGCEDARMLATMIADPTALTAVQAERWLEDVRYPGLVDALTGLVAQTAFARRKADAWRRKKGEWVGRAGWMLVSRLAMSKADVPDDYWRARLEEIEAGIHRAPNRVREAMNSALIAIGIRSAALEKAAVAAARRIGPVEVDHGETYCKTPDAVAYIRKARQRKS